MAQQEKFKLKNRYRIHVEFNEEDMSTQVYIGKNAIDSMSVKALTKQERSLIVSIMANVFVNLEKQCKDEQNLVK